jgi:hypothetical protein
MTVSSAAVPRRVVGGVSVLLYPGGPYLEVAERVRAVHAAGWSLSVEDGEVREVRPGCWIYRASLQVNGRRYIGDAEIHLGALPDSPDGTNPISCAQTSAVGQALEFAGFGDLKSVLRRLGQQVNLAALGVENASTDGESPRQEIAGVQTILLDHTPYVPVAERLYQLHLSGARLEMERCEILELAGIWVYRATVQVDEHRYLGDAEIFFDAAPGTPDATHPVTCAQLSAVGNALALAGFGDVRSILQRLGQDAQGIDTPPLLASADAVIRARRQGRRSQAARPVDEDRQATADQRQQIATLCQHLGEAEPVYDTLDVVAADQLIAHLQREQEELLRTADEARKIPVQNPPEAQCTPAASVVDQALVRQLKKRWRERFQPAGETAAQQAAWGTFKTRLCGKPVSDQAMLPAEYEQLLAAISGPSSAEREPARQAPRLTPASSTCRS